MRWAGLIFLAHQANTNIKINNLYFKGLLIDCLSQRSPLVTTDIITHANGLDQLENYLQDINMNS